jgi:hypothetical protein
MSKVKSATLRREIERLAGVIHQKHAKLPEAEKKELAFIHKHLRKAAREMVRIAARMKTVPPKKKASPASRKRTKRQLQVKKNAPAASKPSVDTQAK